MRQSNGVKRGVGKPGASPVGSHAVVIGGSIAGLLAARVLADAYERVTVIDRDELPEGNEHRRAVPQGRQPHALLACGQEVIEELLPGIVEEMIDDGAATYAAIHDVRFAVSGHKIARTAGGRTAVTASRPFIEGHVRHRVRALGNVELRARCEAQGLLAGADRRRVTGVRVHGAAQVEEELAADLVVAATGRSARIPAWLEELGYERPQESTLQIDVAYATRAYRLPADAMTDKLILLGPRPDLPRSVALFAQENDEWLLTIGGYGEHRPPTEEGPYDEFLETVAPADVLEAVRAGERLGEVVTFGFPAERRRHYERMRRFPQGLLVIGDAICSFNPLYGQGMTVAALEAAALGRCLRRGSGRLRRRYLRATTKVVDQAWQLATAADLALPVVEGPRPRSQRLLNSYVERLRERAEEDGDLSAALARVGGMVDKPARLLRPAVARRVLGRRGVESPPWPGRPPRTALRRRTLRVDGLATPLQEAGPSEASEAAVFVHGVPGSGDDFEPLLAAAGLVGRAVAWDAPGFGQADKPDGFDHSLAGHGEFLGKALDALGIERAHLVLHDFGGGSGLSWAAAEPQRVASVTLICAGVLLDYRWHRTARLWRTPLVGELFMATATRAGFGAGLRRGQARRLPGPFVDRMFEDFDRDTRAAILRIYRSVGDLGELARGFVAALRPHDIPALAIWGADDPYLPASLAERQREAFPGAEVHVLDGCGHWPFVDRGRHVEELLVEFLARRFAAAGEPEGEVQLA